jgi:hypothetical protein
MMSTSEPVIVILGTGREAIADVLIAVTEEHQPAVRCSQLHERYPGLTVALATDGCRLHVRFRDGAEAILATTSATGWSLDAAATAARRLYRQWIKSGPRSA